MSDGVESDTNSYTVRLELIDRPGELLRALEPIAEHGGNLLSIFHERGNRTPRGRIPVEVDLEATPERFDRIVTALRETDINVIQAGAERYGEELTVILIGHLVETDLSETLMRIQTDANATVEDVSLTVGTEEEPSSARIRVATQPGKTEETLSVIREVATEKEFTLIEPLRASSQAGDGGEG